MTTEPENGDNSGDKARLDAIYAQMEELEKERREIYKRSLDSPDAEKVCNDTMAEILSEPPPPKREPFTVRTSVMGTAPILRPGLLRKTGTFVSIRPCAEEYEGKTYLGLYLGDLAQSVSIKIAPQIQAMQLDFSMHNPAIWVFKLNKIIQGSASFWSPIKSPAQLRKITDEDIDNCWYVKAARKMLEEENADRSKTNV